MHIILLYSHVILMCISLFATASIAVVAIMNQYISPRALKANLLVTIGGVTSGIILLISYPLAVRCIILTAYVGVFILIHRFVRAQQNLYLNKRTASSIVTQR